MQNFIQQGEVIDFVTTADLTAGQAFVINSTTELVGVATNTSLSGAVNPIRISGVCEITGVSAETGAVGAKIYLDNTATPAFSRATTVSTSNKLAGVLAEPKTNGQTTVKILLNRRLT